MKSTSKEFTKTAVDHIVQKDPIEYKKVDPTQFSGYTVNKFPVQQDNNGYVNTDLLKEFKKVDKCTTIVNVGIGQGKTTAVYEYIKYLSSKKDYIVVLASPFITLVEKDFRELTATHKIPEDQILLYSDLKIERAEVSAGLSEFNFGHLMSDQTLFEKGIIPTKRIHIITINSLLGNPGESAFVQATLKHDYLNALLRYCKSSKKKIVFILDEIHESVHNFANPFIYNIMKWKVVTHKAILLTATYTVPVDIILKHFAYLTNDTIKILESDRIKKKSDLANLHLCYTNKNYSSNDIDELEFIKHIVEESDNIETTPRQVQILSFSRRIASEIYNVSNEWLPNRTINLSTGSSEEKFDPTCSNIGTNFKTGVNIGTRDLYFIILPCKYTNDSLKDEYGIFSDGVPSIIQSIARMRTNGDIYIIIPPVNELLQDEYIAEYLPLNTHTSKSPIISDEAIPDDQKQLEDIYNFIYKRIENTEKRYINDTKKSPIKRPEIQYPKLDTFILERGQQFLVSRFLRHGKHVAPFIIWSAFHDQLVNTNLKEVHTHQYNIIELKLYPSNLFSEFQSFLAGVGVDLQTTNPVNTYNNIISSLKTPTINGKTFQIEVEYNRATIPLYYGTTLGQLHSASILYSLLSGEKLLFDKEMYINYHISISKRNKTGLNSLGKAYLNISIIIDLIESRIKSANLTHLPKKRISQILPNWIKNNEFKMLENAVDEINTNDPLIKNKFAFFKGVKFISANKDQIYNHVLLNFFMIGKKQKSLGPNNKIRAYLFQGLKYTVFNKTNAPNISFVYS